MCGIAGFWNLITGAPVNREKLISMNNALTHRGPDSGGLFIDGTIGLAHRRLSILDLAGGVQPWSDPEGLSWIVFNGEIYNYLELREELEIDGLQFRTSCDTEVIPYAYIKYGIDFPNKLSGMFAIALWDTKKRELILTRDPFGKKPLLYAWTSNGIVFASEMQSLLKADGVDTTVSMEAISAYLSLGYVPHELCIFKSVRKVPPGCSVKINTRGEIRENRYWHHRWQVRADVSEGDAKEEFVLLLREAVRRRLRSDVPLGTFLSGGIDSSLITAITAMESGKKVRTFCIGFEDGVFDEREPAKRVARYIGTDHSEDIIRMDAVSILSQLQRHYGEPFGDPSALPTYYLCQATRRHVTVALSGDGGDELFAGYNKYKRLWLRATVRHIIKNFPIIPQLLRLRAFSPKDRLSSWFNRALNALGEVILPPAEQYSRLQSFFYPRECDAFFLQGAVSSSKNGGPAENIVANIYQRFAFLGDVQAALLVDQNLYLPDDILVKVDIASMANSLEVRCPFLDIEIARFANQLPVYLKFRSGVGKLLLKQVALKFLPRDIVYRRKHGFAVPISRWLKEDLGAFADDVMVRQESLIRQIFDIGSVKSMLAAHRGGKSEFGHQLWLLLCLAVWSREYKVG
jgi:asparagine synthase (glutamine-hydrolysing)